MMEQETVQIDAPDFDPDIDGTDTQWAHHTTAVVSAMSYSPHQSQNPLMPQIHKKKLQIGTSLIQDILIQKIPIDLTISPSKFQTIHLKIISQNNRSPQQNTAFLMKSHN